ncbi:MAG: hypothetical protein IRY94_03205 [Rhodospirillaceae bacterium]|nr:hypothetical protein [Rhodospirillaceae bacterium]
MFVLSLLRTGTQSTHELLEAAGRRGIHWPARFAGVDYQARIAGHETDPGYIVDVLAPVIAAHDVLSDVPICALYETLAERYPDSLFLALTRPAADWVRSVRRHVGAQPLDPYEKVLFWRYLPGRPASLAAVSDEALTDMHRRHHEGLRSFFAGSGRFRLLELYDPRAGEAICAFLGLPPRPLPHFDYMSDPPAAVRRLGRLARAAWQRFNPGRS